MRRIGIAAVVAALGFGVSGAFGVPVQWATADGGNGHYYDFVRAIEVSWGEADVAARASSFLGVSGNLATLTSAGENAFVVGAFPGAWGPDQNGWLGGYQDRTAADYSEPAGGWRWVTGETWGYTNWFSGVPTEPDNFGGSQDFLRSNVGGMWDDVQEQPKNPSIQTISGFFVEYAVPEPGVGMLIMTGGLLRRSRGRSNDEAGMTKQ